MPIQHQNSHHSQELLEEPDQALPEAEEALSSEDSEEVPQLYQELFSEPEEAPAAEPEEPSSSELGGSSTQNGGKKPPPPEEPPPPDPEERLLAEASEPPPEPAEVPEAEKVLPPDPEGLPLPEPEEVPLPEPEEVSPPEPDEPRPEPAAAKESTAGRVKIAGAAYTALLINSRLVGWPSSISVSMGARQNRRGARGDLTSGTAKPPP